MLFPRIDEKRMCSVKSEILSFWILVAFKRDSGLTDLYRQLQTRYITSTSISSNLFFITNQVNKEIGSSFVED